MTHWSLVTLRDCRFLLFPLLSPFPSPLIPSLPLFFLLLMWYYRSTQGFTNTHTRLVLYPSLLVLTTKVAFPVMAAERT